MRPRRARRVRADWRPAAGLLAGATLGGFGAAIAAPVLVAHLGPPVAVDPVPWMLLVPGLDQSLADADEASGTGIVDGALSLCVRSFGRTDILFPRAQAAVAAVEVRLAADSGPLVINAHDAAGDTAHVVELGPTGWTERPGGALHPYTSADPIRVRFGPDGTHVDGEALARPAGPPAPTGPASAESSAGVDDGYPRSIELAAVSEPPRIRSLRVEGVDGAVLAEGTFGYPRVSGVARAVAGGIGAVTAGLGWVVLRGPRLPGPGLPGPGLARRAARLAACLLGPLAVLATPYARWRALAERLYLLHTSAADLRIGVFLAALGLLVPAALIASGALELARDPGAGGEAGAGAGRPDAGVTGAGAPRERGASIAGGVGLALGALFLLVDALGCRALTGIELLWAAPGALVLALPWRGLTALGFLPRGVLLRELPSYALVAGLGWQAALLPLALWRLVCLWVDTPVLLARGARLGADALFATLLCLPVGVEGALRSTYLRDAWDPRQLAGASVGETGRSEVMVPFWQGSCEAAAADRLRVDTFGGSSAGGAYQFNHEPGWFFPARLHERLCAAGMAVTSRNFGNGGRDSHDAAVAAPGLFAADPPGLVILYFGVNDLLTRDSPYSRKERAARAASQAATAGGADALASTIRTLTGLSLLLRPPEGAQQLVVAVPLADAEENLRTVQAAAAVAGAELLLVTEYTNTASDAELEPYWTMERRLAGELPHTRFIDLRQALGPDRGQYLFDRNHMTREGNDRVGAILAEAVLGQ